MRTMHWKLALAAVVALGVAAPVAASADELALIAQGQGQGRGNQGRGNDDAARPQGNQGRGNDDAARPQGNQGRGNANAARGDDNRGRGNDDAARGQGNQGRGNANAARGQGNQARGNANVDRDERGNRSATARGRDRTRPDRAQVRASIERMPVAVRRLVNSNRRGERTAAGAVALATMRGLRADQVRVEDGDGFTLVKNREGRELFRLDDDEELGAWRMRRLGDRRPNDNSPAFCRSGEGHPVWGREWCLDKGFGLGGDADRRIWSRADDDLGIIFRRRPEADVLDSRGLIDILGDVIFGRLAVQSLVLGNDEPLVGRWVASSDERDAPYVLRVTAGDIAIAELVDDDRDDEVDVLYVAQPRW
ncbi:MAG TPA: hypothetical protein VF039_08985 [Longimicrobiales bacterium]